MGREKIAGYQKRVRQRESDAQFADMIVSAEYALRAEKKIPLPLMLENCQAGFPSPADDYMDGTLDLNEKLITHPAATFLMRVSGTSMTDAGILNGSLLVVDRALKPRDGSIVVAVIEGALTVKRLKFIKGHPWLMPESKDYEPVKVTDESFEVWGVVAHVVNTLQ